MKWKASPGLIERKGNIMNEQEMRRKIGISIIESEIRRDKNGHIAVYHMPKGDGGGTYEVAGINDRYHPQEAAKLKKMIEAGQYAAAEAEVGDYIISYTDVVRGWLPSGFYPSTETVLRDTCFNAGPTGAAKVLQMALNVTVDGKVGPNTRGATVQALALGDTDLALRLVGARWEYMHGKSENPGKGQFWKGWRNRMTNCAKFALSLA